MILKNYLLKGAAVIAAAVILNCFAVNFLYCRGEYITVSDIAGNEYLEKRSTLRYADSVISKYKSEDYEAAVSELEQEANRLESYISALRYSEGKIDPKIMENISSGEGIKSWSEKMLSEYDLTGSQAEERISQIEYCIERLKYAGEYSAYVNKVNDNSSIMLSLPMMAENKFIVRNASKAKRDFYGLDEIRPSAESDIGIICLFSDRITDIIVISAAAAVSWIYVQYRKKFPFGRAGIFSVCAALLVGAAAVYSAGTAVIADSVGLGDISRPIQSVRTFFSCSSVMSTAAMAAARVVFKLVICAAVYFISAGIMLSPKNRPAWAVIIIAVIINVAFYNSGGAAGAASLLNAFSAERIFGIYGNIDLFGNAVSPAAVFIPSVIAAIVLSAVFAVKSVYSFVLSAREAAERAYYSEIEKTYDETRKIRHDINNHLSALAILIDGGKFAEARNYLSEISDELYLGRLPVNTGRPVLDALISGKISAAEKENITLNINFSAVFGDKYSDFDLCGIFGNILDNAIEGCRRIYGEKTISLTVKKQQEMMIIFCENTCAPDQTADDLSTVKSDRRIHGFGLKRIKQLSEKYGGGMDISVSDNIFTVSVIL